MMHKIAGLLLGLLCLAPVYTLMQIIRAGRCGVKSQGFVADYPDLIAIALLAFCGLCLCGFVVFGLTDGKN